MFLPPEFEWAELPLIGAGIVFVIDLIGNMISFNNRFLNALATALVFLVIFGTLSYMSYKDSGSVPTISTPEAAPTPAPAPN